MNEIYIWHHLGLGDHVTCNAIVRNYCKKYDKVNLFVKDRNLKNVQYMFRDLNNLEFIHGKGDQDEFVRYYLDLHRFINLLMLRFDNAEIQQSGLNFDELFYKKANIPFNRKFEDCYIPRNEEKEDEVCKIMNPSGEPYVFIHQDSERGHLMNMDHIKDKSLKVISSDFKLDETKTYLIFDYMKLIEEAQEVHVMESSFKCMIDGYIKEKENMFFHKYMRPGVSAIGRNYWNIIN